MTSSPAPTSNSANPLFPEEAQMPALLAGLNEKQKEAVTLPDGHALILAGAGSGKTRVLTTRIAWLLRNRRLSPASILAVTFTNKAAREMFSRLTALLNFDPGRMWVGTFHGLCHRMLRAHHRLAGLPQSFQIIDTSDQLAILRRLYKVQGISEESYPLRETLYFINARKEEGQRPADVEALDAFTEHKLRFYRLYDEHCRSQGLVDFAELLLATHELLRQQREVREHYQARFHHILVDEFQDTNALQYRWLCQFAGSHTSLFCVGDDDQSIYAFRGARVENMHSFQQEYPGPTIRLEQNYRSSGAILDAANALISHNSARLGKELWTAEGRGDLLRVFVADSDNEEARWLVEEVQQLHRAGLALHQMAVLYRSNAQSRVLEQILFSASIPYRVYGGQRFFDRLEIKHALAYLRLLQQPDDDTAFLRVVNFPTRGIGTRSIEALQTFAQQQHLSLYQAIGPLAEVEPRAAAAIQKFRVLLMEMREVCRNATLPQIVERMLDRSGLREHYRNDKAPDHQERLDNLDELVSAATAFVTEDEDGLDAFLAHATLEAGENQANRGQDALQLMTVHAAKGLEFSAVFLSGLEEGLFPHEQSIHEPRGLEEERRLMYVALTRARRKLYLSLSRSRMLHGQLRYGMPSRFIEEMPEELLHWLSPPPSTSHRDHHVAAPMTSYRSRSRPHTVPAGGRPASWPGATATPAAARITSRWHLGQAVLHPKFGQGIILAIQGSGEEACARINFQTAGEKTIALALGKLQPLVAVPSS